MQRSSLSFPSYESGFSDRFSVQWNVLEARVDLPFNNSLNAGNEFIANSRNGNTGQYIWPRRSRRHHARCGRILCFRAVFSSSFYRSMVAFAKQKQTLWNKFRLSADSFRKHLRRKTGSRNASACYGCPEPFDGLRFTCRKP